MVYWIAGPDNPGDGLQMMNNKQFSIYIVALLILGIFLGYVLSQRPSFSASGILNVVGISYSITAVLVLYESVTKNSLFRTLTVNILSPLILWLHTVVPLGVALSWILTRGTLHGGVVSRFGLSFFAYSILPLSFLDSTVVFPRINGLREIDGRYRRFGLFLLLSGLGMQLIAAVMSL
jgi:hypothetical protein